MKNVRTKSLAKLSSRIVAALALASVAAVAARAQEPARLRLESIERLAPKATQTVNIEVDSLLIKLASGILSDTDPGEKNVKEIIAGLKGVYVKSFEFKTKGEFTEADIEPVRTQLRAPIWKRLVDVETRGVEIDDAEVYVATEAGRVEGMTVLVVHPKEITVVNIVGQIDLDKIKKIEGSLGIPRITVKRKKEGDKPAPERGKP